MPCGFHASAVDILYLLIPLSSVLVLGIVGVFAWALHKDQFDDLESEGERILLDEPQGRDPRAPQKFNPD
jgi:cbb3-type cytochrome oxidase maturation protein